MFHEEQKLCMESLMQLRLQNKQKVMDLQSGVDLAIQYEFINGAIQNVKNFLSKSLGNIGAWFSELKNTTPDPLPHFVKIEKDMDTIHKFCKNDDNYLKYSSHSFPYIVGCELNIKLLGEKLSKVRKNHVEVIFGLLDDCDTFISQVAASEDFRRSNAPITLSSKVKEGVKFTEEIDKLHLDVIKGNRHEDRMLLTELCNNLRELDDCSNSISELKKSLAAKPINEVLARVEAISAKAKVLSDDITNGEVKCSQAVVNGIKLQLGSAANAVTALSTYYYLVSQYALTYKAIAGEISSL